MVLTSNRLILWGSMCSGLGAKVACATQVSVADTDTDQRKLIKTKVIFSSLFQVFMILQRQARRGVEPNTCCIMSCSH